MELPLVSIVTPSYNMAQYLPEALDSVLSQDYANIELIVMDGGSTDETAEVLKQYEHRIRYVIAKDEGPSDAIHRGFLQASGSIYSWLNADDRLLPGAVRAAAEYLAAHPTTDVVYGEANWIDEAGAPIGRYPTVPFDPKLLAQECFICQPTAFMRSSAYRRCGLDPSVKWSFDYDLWIRMAKQGFCFDLLPRHQALSRMHRGAITFHERENVLRDSMRLLQRHYGYVPFRWVYGYAAYRIDRRDQFFEPLQYSFGRYLASLPLGFRYNPTHGLHFLGEWLTMGGKGLARQARQFWNRPRKG